ncbi:DNA polymerase III delta prime subunit [Actinoplanes lutulentus]|nr:NACHT domain-containing protein [Actinoplanes lutulentus]MBB2940318.1 DNA polymerase III delta prime subunit [Actinoplanes lutulentus]
MSSRAKLVAVDVVVTAVAGLVANAASTHIPAPLDRPWVLWPFLIVLVPVLIATAVRIGRAADVQVRAAPERQRREFLAQVKYRLVQQDLAAIYATSPRITPAVSVHSSSSVHSGGSIDSRTITRVFAEARTVLILGPAGAGKTVALLELARDLIRDAERDREEPVPVLLSLSSWATKRPPFPEWLAGELARSYRMPTAMATAWIEEARVLPLLDGLDTVPDRHRGELVRAINEYLVSGFTRLAVTSRIEDYRRCREQLLVAEQLEIACPDEPQVRAYLRAAGMKRPEVNRFLPVWRDEPLLATPLMLQLSLRVGPGAVEQALGASGQEAQRRVLFDAYLAQALNRLGGRRDTLASLSTIARWMTDNTLTVFQADRLQPAILGAPALWTSLMAVTWFLIGFVPFIPVLALGVAVGGNWISTGLILAASAGIWTMLLGLLMRHDRVIRRSYHRILDSAPRRGLHWVILPVESWRWSWITARARAPLFGSLFALQVPLVLLADLPAGRQVAAMALPALTLINGVGRTPALLAHRPRFNEGIIRTARRIVPTSVLVAVLGGGSMGLLSGPASGLLFSITMVPLLAMFVGYPVVQHYLLRALLARRQALPFRLEAFLEACATANLLRFTGDGYTFVHPLLQDHLTPDSAPAAPGSPRTDFLRPSAPSSDPARR